MIEIMENMKKRQDQLEDELDKLKRIQEEKDTELNKTLDDRIASVKQHTETKMKEELSTLKTAAQESKGVVQEQQLNEVVNKTIDDKLHHIQPKWTEVVTREVKENFNRMKDEMNEMQEMVVETKNMAVEVKDKEERGDNIVIYNAPESVTESNQEWLQNERRLCMELFNDILNVDMKERDIKKIMRLGARGTTKCRPLLVQFSKRTVKNAVMESLKNLKGAKEPFSKVVVCHDMTKKERAECKKLVEKAKQKEEQDQSGEYVYRVRGPPHKLVIVRLRKQK